MSEKRSLENIPSICYDGANARGGPSMKEYETAVKFHNAYASTSLPQAFF